MYEDVRIMKELELRCTNGKDITPGLSCLRQLLLEEKEGTVPPAVDNVFLFLRGSYFLDSGVTSLERHQEIDPRWFIKPSDAKVQLFISHRWATAGTRCSVWCFGDTTQRLPLLEHPDPSGSHFQTIKQQISRDVVCAGVPPEDVRSDTASKYMLTVCSQIGIWYDWSVLPQHPRTADEAELFMGALSLLNTFVQSCEVCLCSRCGMLLVTNCQLPQFRIITSNFQGATDCKYLAVRRRCRCDATPQICLASGVSLNPLPLIKLACR